MTDLEKIFCSYELSFLAKENGFNEPCFAWYTIKSNYLHYEGKFSEDSKSTLIVDCPLKSQLTDWLREKHKMCLELFSTVDDKNEPEFMFSIYDLKIENNLLHDTSWNSDYHIVYNEALTKAVNLL